MRRMASNSNTKMGKASVFWVDGLVDAFLLFSKILCAFRMKFESQEKGSEKQTSANFEKL